MGDAGASRLSSSGGADGRWRTEQVVASLVALAAIVAFASTHVGLAKNHVRGHPTVLSGSTVPAAGRGGDVIGIRWGPRDLSAATGPGQICVETGRHGKVCAFYTTGERPADSLRRELERRGLQVRSSG